MIDEIVLKSITNGETGCDLALPNIVYKRCGMGVALQRRNRTRSHLLGRAPLIPNVTDFGNSRPARHADWCDSGSGWSNVAIVRP